MAKTTPIISVAAADDRAFFMRQGHGSYLRWDGRKVEEYAYDAQKAYWLGTPLAPSYANWCCTTDPEPALVTVNWPGQFSVATKDLRVSGDLWERCAPLPTDQRTGDVVRLIVIDGRAHAVVNDGGVFRLDVVSRWTRLDDGLPRSFRIRGLAGTTNDLHAVGREACWHFDGKKWRSIEIPLKPDLNAVTTAGGDVYAVGGGGVCMRLSRGKWTEIEDGGDEGSDEDLWGIAAFGGVVYTASMRSLYRIVGNKRELVCFGKQEPGTCYHVIATANELWSVGEFDVMRFDGRNWKRLTWFDGKKWLGISGTSKK